MQKSLLIGCGNSRAKKIHQAGQPDWTGQLVTIDMNPDCGADRILDMSIYCTNMPFADAEFDELAAYDTLEHWGRQGDWRGWFQEMAEYHRILKPGGRFGIIVPVGSDALADPGHTRFFSKSYFYFLNQKWYEEGLAQGLQITDYRWFWKLHFEIEHLEESEHHIAALLRKPL